MRLYIDFFFFFFISDVSLLWDAARFLPPNPFVMLCLEKDLGVMFWSWTLIPEAKKC